jgi:hypothetical protein
MVEKAINDHKPGTAFANIIALSDSLLGSELTNNLIGEKGIDIEAFQKWQDEFAKEINQDKTLSPKIKQYAINGKIAEVIPIMENAIKAVLTNRNLQPGVAYAKEGNVDSDKGEGAKIKAAIEQLLNLEKDLDQANRKLRQESIIKNIAQEVSNLFHYPYVDKQKQIDEKTKKELVDKKEYRSLESFRSNNVDLFIVQLSHLLGSAYEQYPGLIGTNENKIYPKVNEAVVRRIVNDGNWQHDVDKWHQEQNNNNSNNNSGKDAILSLIQAVDDMLHSNQKFMGLLEGADSEAKSTEGRSKSLPKSGSEEQEESGEESIEQARQHEDVQIEKQIVLEEMRSQIKAYEEDKDITTISATALMVDLNNLKQNCIAEQKAKERQTEQKTK